MFKKGKLVLRASFCVFRRYFIVRFLAKLRVGYCSLNDLFSYALFFVFDATDTAAVYLSLTTIKSYAIIMYVKTICI